MSNTKRNIVQATIYSGLSSANKHNPFWTQSDAMSLINLYRSNI